MKRVALHLAVWAVAGATLLAAVSMPDYLRTRDAVSEQVRIVDDREIGSCGKGGTEHLFTLEPASPPKALPGRFTTKQCLDGYAVGDVVVVRRAGDTVVLDPPESLADVGWIALLGGVLGTFVGVLWLLGRCLFVWVETWREARRRK